MQSEDTRALWAYRQMQDFAEDRREWIREVMADTDIEPTHRLVGVAIGLRMNHATEDSWPSVKRIAKDVGVSPRTVIRAIQVLSGEDEQIDKKDGTIKRPSKGKSYLIVVRGKRRGNRYSMNIAHKIK